MQRVMLKSKIHQAKVTETDFQYEGSLTLDWNLMKEAGMIPFEQVHVYNISNGERFITYLIKGEEGTGVVGVNGAAAHKAKRGDKIIIASYVIIEDKDIDFFLPKVLILHDENRIREIK